VIRSQDPLGECTLWPGLARRDGATDVFPEAQTRQEIVWMSFTSTALNPAVAIEQFSAGPSGIVPPDRVGGFASRSINAAESTVRRRIPACGHPCAMWR
jgi:hypothetical protein